jgi:transcriptional regulator with XRE-family HTH domain
MSSKADFPVPETRIAEVIEPFTNTEVGAVVGKDPSLISRWRSGERRPQYEELRELCVWLGISAGWVIGLTNERRLTRAQPTDDLVWVARVGDLESATQTIPDPKLIREMVPFTQVQIRKLIGGLPEPNQHRLLIIDTHDCNGKRSTMMIDRSCDRTPDQLEGGSYLVNHREQLVVRRVMYHSRTLICSGAEDQFVIRPAAESNLTRYLIGKVVLTVQRTT